MDGIVDGFGWGVLARGKGRNGIVEIVVLDGNVGVDSFMEDVLMGTVTGEGGE